MCKGLSGIEKSIFFLMSRFLRLGNEMIVDANKSLKGINELINEKMIH